MRGPQQTRTRFHGNKWKVVLEGRRNPQMCFQDIKKETFDSDWNHPSRLIGFTTHCEKWQNGLKWVLVARPWVSHSRGEETLSEDLTITSAKVSAKVSSLLDWANIPRVSSWEYLEQMWYPDTCEKGLRVATIWIFNYYCYFILPSKYIMYPICLFSY